MSLFRRWGLTRRAIAVCAALLLGSIVLLGAALMWDNYRDSMETMTEHALVQARSVSYAAEPALLLNDAKALRRVVMTASQDRDLCGAEIIDARGRVLASLAPRPERQPDTRPAQPSEALRRWKRLLAAGLTDVRRSAGRLVVTTPIWRDAGRRIELDLLPARPGPPARGAAPIGLVRLTFSLARIRTDLAERLLFSAWIAAGVLAVGLTVTVLLARRLLAPLRNLAETAAAIARGQRARRAAVGAAGEIGALARSFNFMAQRLEESYASIERKVARRTAELEARRRELEQEIERRARMAAALRASEANYRQIFNAANDAIFIHDADSGAICDVNEKGCQMFGYTRREICARPLAALGPGEPPHTQQEALRWIRKAAAQGPQLLEWLARDNSGRLFWVEVSLKRARIGGAERILAVVRDVSARKQAETELRRAKEAAEAASRAKSLFLANMSHEIRTPMTAILGFAESLLEPGLSESERLDAVNTIRRNGNHLLRIINDILDVSKIEAGKLRLERVACAPAQVLADVASLMRPRASAKGLEFRIECAAGLPPAVCTDPTRLRQILINLVGNAIKFTEKGSVTLRARPAPGPGARQQARLQFEVADTGPGMTPAEAERVFAPFAQADETMTRRFGGTGLGLAISRKLAELLGGSLTLTSMPGAGSVFRLDIPALPVDGAVPPGELPADDQLAPAAAVPDRPSGDLPRLNCRVLLAEDGPDNQRLISHLLEKAGAQVTIAENGRQAVDLALAAERQGARFDAILMDMQMPLLDGYAATSLLRRKGYRGPIVALTAHAMPSDRVECLRAGCDDFATKPINRKRLLALIERWAGRAAAVCPAARR